MKHIKKRFLFEEVLTEEQRAHLDKVAISFEKAEGHNVKMGQKSSGFIETEEGKFIRCFQQKIGNKRYFIPEPDPVLIYFNRAYFDLKGIPEVKEKMIAALDLNVMTENVRNELYAFFGISFSFATMCFSAMEAFMNRAIPEGFVGKIVYTGKTEVFTKEQIERFWDFRNKIENALDLALGKSFGNSYPLKMQHIWNLKEFRDMIIHAKAIKGTQTPYDQLFKTAIRFKYEETYDAVKDWINFYSSSEYIVDCDCGLDF